MRKKKSHFKVLAILCLSQSTYSVPDMLFEYKTLTQRWREGGVSYAMGKFQKLPNQTAVAQRNIRSFQAVPLQQKSHHWPSSCWTSPHPALFVTLQMQPLQQMSEHSARTDGYVHAGLPSVLREARPAATTLLQRKPKPGCAWLQLPSNRTWYWNFESG